MTVFSTSDLSDTTAIILAAGLGTRMVSSLPKVLHPILGRPMVAHVASTVKEAGISDVVAVIGPEGGMVSDVLGPVPTAIQHERLGTAHAVLQARPCMHEGSPGMVLVLYGDTPLLEVDTLRQVIQAHISACAGVTVLGFRASNPAGYGRLVMGGDGFLQRIIEDRDATPEEACITLCNSGVMAIDRLKVWEWLSRVGTGNKKGEYYLTDLVAIARADEARCVVVEGDRAEVVGVNSRGDLAACEAIAQDRMRAAALDQGVTLVDPRSVYFSWDTRLGSDVTIYPGAILGPGVTIGDRVVIKGFCHLESCSVSDDVVIGPYARVRPGTSLAQGARIGNFVEVKNATIGAGAKVNHLSYIGDADIGCQVNIGAGAITCNYDGHTKSRTEIEDGAFIGSNTALVAPIRVGEGALVGAGSTLTEPVPAGALAVSRTQQRTVENGATHFHERRREQALKTEQKA